MFTDYTEDPALVSSLQCFFRATQMPNTLRLALDAEYELCRAAFEGWMIQAMHRPTPTSVVSQ
jgi:hypothetical protein